jgi:hypothetical protein
MVGLTKGRMKAENFREQGAEEDIWALEKT